MRNLIEKHRDIQHLHNGVLQSAKHQQVWHIGLDDICVLALKLL